MNLSQIQHPEIDLTGTMVDSKQSSFNESRALRLFATFVWRADLRREIFQVINERIVVRLDEMRRSLPQLPGMGSVLDLIPNTERPACWSESRANS